MTAHPATTRLFARLLPALLACLWGCTHRPPTATIGPVPAVAAALDAEHTVAVVGFEHPDVLARAVVEVVGPDIVTTAQTWLGFDPSREDAWRALGLDPGAGLAVALDARLRAPDGSPRPLLLLRATDLDPLLERAREAGRPLALSAPGEDGVARLDGLPATLWVGRKAGWTAILPDMHTADATRAAFADWLTGPGDLAAHHAERLRLPAEPRLFAFAFTRPAAALLPSAHRALAAHYVERVPAVSLMVGAARERSRLRIFADDATVATLRQILRPDTPRAALARVFPADAPAFGGAFDLHRGVEGLATLIRPADAALAERLVAGQASAAPIQDLLVRGLTGHFAFTEISTPSHPTRHLGLLAFGVADPAAADQLIAMYVLASGAGREQPSEPASFSGYPGYVLGGTTPLAVARVDDTLIVARGRDVMEAAVARAATSTRALPLDADAILAVDLPREMFHLDPDGPFDDAQRAQARRIHPNDVGGVMRLDGEGLIVEGDLVSTVVTGGLAIVNVAVMNAIEGARRAAGG